MTNNDRYCWTPAAVTSAAVASVGSAQPTRPVPTLISMPERRLPPGVSSPCIRNCCLDDDDVCLGCFRTLDEIIAWGTADDTRRQRILVAAAQRKQQKTPDNLKRP